MHRHFKPLCWATLLTMLAWLPVGCSSKQDDQRQPQPFEPDGEPLKPARPGDEMMPPPYNPNPCDTCGPQPTPGLCTEWACPACNELEECSACMDCLEARPRDDDRACQQELAAFADHPDAMAFWSCAELCDDGDDSCYVRCFSNCPAYAPVAMSWWRCSLCDTCSSCTADYDWICVDEAPLSAPDPTGACGTLPHTMP